MNGRTLALPLAAVLMLSACGGGAYSEAELLANPCALLTDAEVAQVLGGPATTRTEPLLGVRNGMRCTWERPTRSVTELATSASVALYPAVEGMAESLKDPQQYPGSEPVDVGDAAVWDPQWGILHVAVNDTTFLISGRLVREPKPLGEKIPKEVVVSLAKAVASRLS